MKRLLILAFVVLLTACAKEAVSTSSTTNPEVSVGTLFQHEGCTVYRFHDAGRNHYYTRCDSGSTTTLSAHHELVGKVNTVRYQAIQTEASK